MKQASDSGLQAGAGRPLTGGRGLKHRRVMQRVARRLSPPHGGARIETAPDPRVKSYHWVAPSRGGAD